LSGPFRGSIGSVAATSSSTLPGIPRLAVAAGIARGLSHSCPSACLPPTVCRASWPQAYRSLVEQLRVTRLSRVETGSSASAYLASSGHPRPPRPGFSSEEPQHPPGRSVLPPHQAQPFWQVLATRALHGLASAPKSLGYPLGAVSYLLARCFPLMLNQTLSHSLSLSKKPSPLFF
jgi:hypothetical protein